MDPYDFLNFAAWLKDSYRKPANVAFTAGVVRDAAYAVEQSGILSQLAAQASAVEVHSRIDEMLSKEVEIVLRRAHDCNGATAVDVRDAKLGHTLYTRYGNTLAAAIAALVNDQSAKEER